MNNSSIEWTDKTWNPVTGCSKVSAGCKNCYADAMFTRFKKQWGEFNDVKCHDDKLGEPFRLKKPSKIFVNSMSDLFHEKVTFEFIDKVMGVIIDNPRHIFQVLTKRPEIAVRYFASRIAREAENYFPKNLWLGVSVEDQKTADARIPILLEIPASIRFLSCEPLLGELDFGRIRVPIQEDDRRFIVNCLSVKGEWSYNNRKIDWVIAGGESGPNARLMHPDWIRSLRDQCQQAGVPFFFKQWGEYYPREQGHWNVAPLEDYDLSDDKMPEFVKVGKKKAGAMLDGKEWKEFPVVS